MNTTTFKAHLLSMFKDNMYDRYVGNKRTGKLNTRKIYKVNTTDKVFQRKEERKNKRYNISLLVDCSGSMAGGLFTEPKWEEASNAARRLAETFNNIENIDLEIVGFNTIDHMIKEFDEPLDLKKKPIDLIISDITRERTDSGFKFHRALYFDEKTKKVELNGNEVNGSYQHLTQGNCDGKTVYEAVERIKERDGKHIIIMLSDGKPSFDVGFEWHCFDRPKKRYSDYDLKKIVNQAIKDGIIFLGIGMKDASVKKYYPPKNTLVINDMCTLYPELIKIFSSLLSRS